MKPLWAVTGIALLGTAGVAGALVAASPGGEQEVVRQVETATPTESPAAPSMTPGPGVTLWRWMDVTVLIPDETGIRAHPDVIYFDAEGSQSREGLAVIKDDPADSDTFSYVLIDAEKGTIYTRHILDEHRAEMEQVLATVAVSPFNPATAPWPYNGDPPEKSTSEEPSIRPHPATGIYVNFVTGSGGYSGVTPTPVDCDRAWEGIEARNGRSSAFVGRDARTGSVCKNLSHVRPEDLAAFERFLDRVALCSYQDAEC